jgi:hypothetical protein
MSQFHYVSRFSSSTGQNFAAGGAFFFLFIHSLSPLLKIPSTIHQRRTHRDSDHSLSTHHSTYYVRSIFFHRSNTHGRRSHPSGSGSHSSSPPDNTPCLSCPNPVILTCTVPSLKKKPHPTKEHAAPAPRANHSFQQHVALWIGRQRQSKGGSSTSRDPRSQRALGLNKTRLAVVARGVSLPSIQYNTGLLRACLGSSPLLSSPLLWLLFVLFSQNL